MKRLTASLLAIGLVAGSGFASAQSYGNDGYGGNSAYQGQGYAQPANGGYYDYARVVRVDPVMGGYGNGTSSRRCYSESQRGYVQGGYDQSGNGYYDQYGNYQRSGSGGRCTPGERISGLVAHSSSPSVAIAASTLPSRCAGPTPLPEKPTAKLTLASPSRRPAKGSPSLE